MPIIKEHRPLTEGHFTKFNPMERTMDYPDGLLLNPTADPYDQKYFFEWNPHPKDSKPCYTASYVIGAQRIDNEELIIEPKINNIDFLSMFSACLNSGLEAESFSKIYGFDLDADPIKTQSSIFSALTPLLVIHFIRLMQEITAKGLRADYINKNENLKKIKGKIDIINNERKNIINKRFDRTYCIYTERSINTPENRLFKRALIFSKQFLFKMKDNESYSSLLQQVNYCLSFFENVDERIELWEIKNTKKNSLYKNYSDAIKLAKMVLKHFDYTISDIEKKNIKTPVFWMDMALLYEHYVYGLLHKEYGSQVKYQKSGCFGWKPDFLQIKEKIIMDTKYMPQLDWQGLTGDIVGQLSGYARIRSFTNNILHVSDETVVPCLIFYPTLETYKHHFAFNTNKKLIDQATPAGHLVKFYKFAVPMPRL